MVSLLDFESKLGPLDQPSTSLQPFPHCINPSASPCPSHPMSGQAAFERDSLQFARDVATLGQLFDADVRSVNLGFNGVITLRSLKQLSQTPLSNVVWHVTTLCLGPNRFSTEIYLEVGPLIRLVVLYASGTALSRRWSSWDL